MAGAVIPVLHERHEVNGGRGGCCQILRKEPGLNRMEKSCLFNVNAGFLIQFHKQTHYGNSC